MTNESAKTNPKSNLVTSISLQLLAKDFKVKLRLQSPCQQSKGNGRLKQEESKTKGMLQWMYIYHAPLVPGTMGVKLLVFVCVQATSVQHNVQTPRQIHAMVLSLMLRALQIGPLHLSKGN